MTEYETKLAAIGIGLKARAPAWRIMTLAKELKAIGEKEGLTDEQMCADLTNVAIFADTKCDIYV